MSLTLRYLTHKTLTAIALTLTIQGFAASHMAHAQVITDGQTETYVTTDADGHVTVDIAPILDDRISYTEFNVSQAGLDFDNRVVGARTIVNEVTGSNPSLIQGQVEVLGQRAHVILANSNGITVNGGRFVNTGGLVLSTGELSFAERQVGPGIFQLNTVLDTGQGVLRIEGEGLSGTMDRLDLLAHEIKISAPVINDNPDPQSQIALYAGASHAEYDSAIVPTNAASRWSFVTAGLNGELVSSPDAILVDITREASLRSSSILIEVTDLGAGVRYAGDGLASRRAFNILADGELVFDGAQITAATDVNLTGETVTIMGDAAESRQAELNAAFGSVNVTAENGDVKIVDARVTGFSGFDPLGYDGAININAPNGSVSIDSTNEDIQSQLITYSRDDLDVADDIVIVARDNVDINNAVVSSARHVDIEASDINLSSQTMRNFVYADGAVYLNALTGTITNDGGIIQGVQADTENGYMAAVNLIAQGDITNMTSQSDFIGLIYSPSDISILTDTVFVNDTARTLADGTINIDAAQRVEVTIGYPDGAYSNGSDSYITLRNALSRGGSRQSVDFGSIPLNGLLSYISGGAGVTIDTDSLLVRGGDISASQGSVNIFANDVNLEGVYSGRYEYRRRCFLFCRSSGSSTLAVHGGRISAANDVNIDAQVIDILGGEIVALGDINAAAEEISVFAIPVVSIYSRPAGLYNFWAGSTAYIIWQDRLGILRAGGTITIDSPNSVVLDGGQLLADNIVNPAGTTIVSDPRFTSPIGQHHIGFLAQLGLIWDSDDDEDDEDDDG